LEIAFGLDKKEDMITRSGSAIKPSVIFIDTCKLRETSRDLFTASQGAASPVSNPGDNKMGLLGYVGPRWWEDREDVCVYSNGQGE